MTKERLIQLAKSVALSFTLEPSLVCAICEQESSWNPSATRFEPLFKEHYIDRLRLPEPEATQRATSWGLMQLMGQVAREHGFQDALEQLLVPEIGLSWGCRFLETRLQHAEDNVTNALLLWNGGGNPNYPAQVLARVKNYEDSISA
jgi:soluble lytic murein transglycosylase-like protein